MKKVVIIEKSGSLNDANIKKFSIETLFKKCKFKNNENFESRHTWKLNDTINVTLFAKNVGRANSENKYELPPPVDKDLFFGSMILCAHTDQNLTDKNINNFNVENWKKLYDKLMGGFDDLEEEEERSEDEADIDPDDLDENDYLKNSFLAADDESVGKEDESDEEKEFSGGETESDGEFPGSSDDESDLAEDSELDEESYDYDE